MAPLLISAVTSMAGSLLDKWNQATEVPAATQAPRVAFDSLLRARGLAGASPAQPAQLNETTDALLRQLMGSPEVAAALNGQNLPPGSHLEFGSDGALALRLPNGYAQTLNLHPATQILAAGVRASMGSSS